MVTVPLPNGPAVNDGPGSAFELTPIRAAAPEPLSVVFPVPVRRALIATFELLVLVPMIQLPLVFCGPLKVTAVAVLIVMFIGTPGESWIVSLMTVFPPPWNVSVRLAAEAKVKVDGLAAEPSVRVPPVDGMVFWRSRLAVLLKVIGPVNVKLVVSPATSSIVKPKSIRRGLAIVRVPPPVGASCVL